MVMVGARSRRMGVGCLESSGSGLEFEESDMIDQGMTLPGKGRRRTKRERKG